MKKGKGAAPESFDLEEFLPYLLNQAAEVTSRSFQENYRASYGMTRTQWRVMANLGKFGAMTARDICAISHIEKTKVSRAISALERDGLVSRRESKADRRSEILELTEPGQDRFGILGRRALRYEEELRGRLGHDVADRLVAVLRQLTEEPSRSGDLDDPT